MGLKAYDVEKLKTFNDQCVEDDTSTMENILVCGHPLVSVDLGNASFWACALSRDE